MQTYDRAAESNDGNRVAVCPGHVKQDVQEFLILVTCEELKSVQDEYHAHLSSVALGGVKGQKDPDDKVYTNLSSWFRASGSSQS